MILDYPVEFLGDLRLDLKPHLVTFRDTVWFFLFRDTNRDKIVKDSTRIFNDLRLEATKNGIEAG